MDVRRVIGANVRRYRLAADLSQELVAERMGVDRAYLSATELGKTNPTAITLSRLAEALGVKVALLLDEDLPAGDAGAAIDRRASKTPRPA